MLGLGWDFLRKGVCQEPSRDHIGLHKLILIRERKINPGFFGF